jgi:tRNA threonylcarbamoyladenosine biosynthesis protein TsaB
VVFTFMLLLAADTSGKHGSIALAKCSGQECSVLEVVPLEGGTFSAQLVPQISALLKKHGFSKGDIGGFAVVSGPGSFTGLRVGLAAIKGLAEILGKPIAAVSLLEALAASARVEGEIAAVVDAGRNEVYIGEYETLSSRVRLVAERLIARADLLKGMSGARVITADPAIAADLRAAGVPVIETGPVSTPHVAKLGWKKIQAGQTVAPEDLDANYIRRSDAEIFSNR